MIKIQTHGIEAFVKSLGRKSKETQRQVGQATLEAVRIVGNAADARVIIPNQHSGQDNPKAPGAYRYQYLPRRRATRRRADVAAAVGWVILSGHWTTARTPGIVSVFRRLGDGQDLLRKGLWIQRRKPKWVKRPDGMVLSKRHVENRLQRARRLEGLMRQSHTETDEFLTFAKAPRLLKWAKREDRAEQYRKHAIHLTDPDARRILILQPAVDRNLETVIDLYHAAAATGLLS